MKRLLSALLIAVILSVSLTACAPDTNAAVPTETNKTTEITNTLYTDDTSTADEITATEDTTITGDNAAISVKITLGGKSYTATLCGTDAAKEFAKMLPLTLDMNELNGNEKYCYLDLSLPTDSSCPRNINAGDIMLYVSGCLVLFYESFTTSYSYTPIGGMADSAGLADALGGGSATVTFEIDS